MPGRRISRGGRTGRSSPRRKKIWARQTIQQSTLAGNTTSHSLILSNFETAYGAQLIGCTIVRVRMDLFVDSATVEGLLFGLRVAEVDQVTDLAVAPDYGPGTRPHLDWMMWGLLTAPAAVATREVDVRAMRKIDELGQNLVLSVQNAGADPLEWGGAISVLVLLP